jgi:hypothetical protein
MDPIDVDHIHHSRKVLRTTLGTTLETRWLELYRKLQTNQP